MSKLSSPRCAPMLRVTADQWRSSVYLRCIGSAKRRRSRTSTTESDPDSRTAVSGQPTTARKRRRVRRLWSSSATPVRWALKQRLTQCACTHGRLTVIVHCLGHVHFGKIRRQVQFVGQIRYERESRVHFQSREHREVRVRIVAGYLSVSTFTKKKQKNILPTRRRTYIIYDLTNMSSPDSDM